MAADRFQQELSTFTAINSDPSHTIWTWLEHSEIFFFALLQVKVDVERSLWSFTPDWSASARDEARQQLSRLLTASVCSHPPGCVYYYQGLHDVASVLLLTLGQRLGFNLLRVLVVGHLRDSTRESLDPVMEVLGLMGLVVQAADPELAAYLQVIGSGRSIAWLLTMGCSVRVGLRYGESGPGYGGAGVDRASGTISGPRAGSLLAGDCRG